MRTTPNGHPFRIAERSAFDVTPEERQAIYEAAWEKGGLQFRATFHDLLIDKAANDTAAEFIKRKIREIVKDPETARSLADIDHPYAAKRPPIDTDYFETFNRDNVTLVDVRAAPIERITPAGIKTRDRRVRAGHHRLRHRLRRHDRPAAAHGHPRPRRAAAARSLGGRAAHLSRACRSPASPTCSPSPGPGSPRCCATCRWRSSSTSSGSPTASPTCASTASSASRRRPRRRDKWGEQVNEAAHATLLPQATHSWYLGANVPGKPRVFMPYAGGMARYRDICDDVAAKGYEGFVMGRRAAERDGE